MIRKINILLLSTLISFFFLLNYFIDNYNEYTDKLKDQESYIYKMNYLLISINNCNIINKYLYYLKESSFYYAENKSKLYSIKSKLSLCTKTYKDYLYLNEKINLLTQEELNKFILDYWNLIEKKELLRNINLLENKEKKEELLNIVNDSNSYII